MFINIIDVYIYIYVYEFNNLQLLILLKHWVMLYYIIHLLHAHI